MSALELWTRVAIGVLTLGSLIVFVWFVRDLLRMGREGPAHRAAPADPPPREER